MSHIPAYVLTALSQFGQPGFLASTSGFRLMVAVRKAFEALNETLPAQPRYSTLEMTPEDAPRRFIKLTPEQLDAAASAFKAEVSVELTDEEIQLLAKHFVDAFLACREGFAKGGFYDPTAAALQLMSKLSITF